MPQKVGPRLPAHTGRAPAAMASETGKRKPPPCDGLQDIFYGSETDLREEVGREEREEVARTICKEQCELRYACLRYALVTNEKHGVWGGMSPGERREFKIYLYSQGFKGDIPTGKEFRAEVNIFDGDDGIRPYGTVRFVRPGVGSNPLCGEDDKKTG